MKYTKSELRKVLEEHKKWLTDSTTGCPADLSNADLREADLRGADLRWANLSNADLGWANLSNADLSNADLSGADLSGADLSNADLSGADLSGADLREANLSNADLSNANLRRANLSNADLSNAGLRKANLSNADLSNANLDYSCLPLWCGSLHAHFDDRQLVQIAYHLVKAGLNSKSASEETKKELSKLVDFANKFHRVNECGRIEIEEE